jgi:hypothetical protein
MLEGWGLRGGGRTRSRRRHTSSSSSLIHSPRTHGAVLRCSACVRWHGGLVCLRYGGHLKLELKSVRCICRSTSMFKFRGFSDAHLYNGTDFQYLFQNLDTYSC